MPSGHSIAVAATILVTASLCSSVPAQSQGQAGTSGKDCVFHPSSGGAPVPVANGETYTPEMKGRGNGTKLHKWLCKDGKLVTAE